MKTTEVTTPRVFLTDYASYNNGTQFEFGHWVALTDFSDADEFMEYVRNHFEECDQKSPLGFGSIREEMMITDYEGFPDKLYSESMNFEHVYTYINLDEDDQTKVAFIIDQGESMEYALDHYENVYLYEDGNNIEYELFEMYYPEAEKAEQSCPYLEINYERFIKDNYTRFEHNGTHYLVEDNWNN